MNTDDLITGLGSELTPVRQGQLTNGVLLALGGGCVAALASFGLFWGIRSDPGVILQDVSLFAKSVLPLALGLAALALTLAKARPAGRSRAGRAIWLVPAVLAIYMLATLIVTPSAGWQMAIMGKSITTCLLSIPLLSAPILALILLALRRGAPEHPATCGAVGGLAAAGFATTIYSLYCVENSALFYGIWYSLAIIGVAVVGAVAGSILLRW
ncbi:DUF1109 domain-containing protein [Loktanella sp. SALINAS62]|uniref:NrsF family protein n=1 Tax=Loktanella sp. SALINAS62 TaxID=2706124 RepID=UPI001B8CA1FA|nr:DUF1109 domain-containing protein [Loktanella sp. SALINAS62]MBS1302929.1 DUF1109 domain-containing protein [Loktanella sp. SALINAS62]